MEPSPLESDFEELLIVASRPCSLCVSVPNRLKALLHELSRLRSGLIVDVGSHRLEVVRPGYQSETRSFVAVAGQQTEVPLELEEE